MFAACPILEDFLARLEMLSLEIMRLLTLIDEFAFIFPEDLLAFPPAMNLELLGTRTFLVAQVETEPDPSSHRLKDVLLTVFFASLCLFLSISMLEEFIMESRLSSHQMVLDLGR